MIEIADEMSDPKCGETCADKYGKGGHKVILLVLRVKGHEGSKASNANLESAGLKNGSMSSCPSTLEKNHCRSESAVESKLCHAGHGAFIY